MAQQFDSIDGYIATFPDGVAGALTEIREAVHRAVPGAGETIRYQMPTVTLDGSSLVHFAGWQHHIALYPLPDTDGELARDIAPYASGKGTVRIPLDQPMPVALVERLVAELVRQRRSG